VQIPEQGTCHPIENGPPIHPGGPRRCAPHTEPSRIGPTTSTLITSVDTGYTAVRRVSSA
jgi:hypothetical protein